MIMYIDKARTVDFYVDSGNLNPKGKPPDPDDKLSQCHWSQCHWSQGRFR